MISLRASIPALICALMLGACGATENATVPASRVQAGALQPTGSSYKIYVANIGDGTITTFEPDGTQTSPTIAIGNYLYAIAIAPTGKIYAVTFDPLDGPSSDATVTSYKPDGTQTTPTITIKERGYAVPLGLAVDRNGKIYVLSSKHNGSCGLVMTYKPDGTRTAPTFRTGVDSGGIAIDANGKIYVANDTPHGLSSITTYLSDGSATTPTITRGVHDPAGIAVAQDGTIYVANTNSRGHDGTGAGFITSYSADGSGPLHLARERNQAPGGIALAHDQVYVVSSSAYSDSLKTYNLDLQRIAPTVTNGLYEPSGIAIH
jgi:sugar lactone lactonase YvrE